MHFQSRRRVIPWHSLALALAMGSAVNVWAQPPSPPLPSPVPAAPTQEFPPALPPGVAAPVDTSKEALEARIRQLETMVNQLSGQVQQISTSPAPGGPAGPDVPSPGDVNAPSATGGTGAPGHSLPPNPPASPRFASPATLENKRANVKFGPGFEVRTNDDEFIFQFHNLTQFEYRGYQQGGQSNVRDTFTFPRQWWMFSGRAGKPFGYFVSIANGFDLMSLLDVFLDVEYDPRLKLRIGRFKTPFTYEFLVEPVQGLVVPERSVFFNNFGQNRDLGIMAFGRLFDNTFDYAGGIFNGNRNGFLANDNSKKVSGYINWRPMGNNEGSLFENLNIGGSVFAGDMSQAASPQIFRTVVATSGNTVAGIPFLGFNNNIREAGYMAFWDLHLAYYYKQFALISEWGSGFQTYAPSNALQARTRLPVQSYYVQGSYLLTGETRSSIGIVKPISPFDIRKGNYGTGAIEPYFRYEYMNVGNQVFSAGLADPNNWANALYQTHTGVNWHLTQYVKLYFDWNHAEFNQPVLFAPGRRQLTSDMFMLRLQLYF
jgi:phosphate-selective porin OprO and OprP